MDLRIEFQRKKFWINDFLHGGQMWNDFKEIEFIYNNPVPGEEIRKKHLSSILEYAIHNIPFYKDIHSLNIKDFPIIDKTVLKANFNKFIAVKESVPGQKGDFHIQSTSGSTGTPFSFPQDTRCRIRRIATIKFGNELVNFHSFEPMCHMRAGAHYWGGGKDIFYRKDLNITYIDNTNLNASKIERIIKTYNDSQAKVIRGYCTPIDTIASYAIKHGLEFIHHPTFILGGEVMLNSTLHKLHTQLGCDVISQYANEENGVFGQTAVNGNGSEIILNRANCIIEILKFNSDAPVSPGELGRIVVTDFTNYAMPMIRYDIGDAAMIGETKDGILTSISNLVGRKTDLIYCTNGKGIDMFNSCPHDIYNNPLINQWQFIQKSKKTYQVNLCTNDEVIKRQESHYINEFKLLLGDDAIIQIQFLDELPILSSGKRRCVICESRN